MNLSHYSSDADSSPSPNVEQPLYSPLTESDSETDFGSINDELDDYGTSINAVDPTTTSGFIVYEKTLMSKFAITILILLGTIHITTVSMDCPVDVPVIFCTYIGLSTGQSIGVPALFVPIPPVHPILVIHRIDH